jgi:hypothetical protein
MDLYQVVRYIWTANRWNYEEIIIKYTLRDEWFDYYANGQPGIFQVAFTWSVVLIPLVYCFY